MKFVLSADDAARISAAATAAEGATDGEIVTIVARRSDGYHDVALHWSVLAMLLALAWFAAFPGIVLWVAERLDPWALGAPSMHLVLTIVMIWATLKFLGALLILSWRPARMFMTPPGTKARRVRRRAMELFHAAVDSRTRAKTGVLLYLSLEEHRAEIVADAAIHSKVAPEVWGEAMAALIGAVRDRRAGDGMVDAVGLIGKVLAEHFPRSADDTNELPDRLILL